MTGFDTQPTPGATKDIGATIDTGTSICPHTAMAAAELLLDAIGVQAGDMVLDLASGLGHGAGLASQRGAIATGIDRHEAPLDEARRRYRDALYYGGNPESLVFANGFFAAVIHHSGLQTPPSPAALAEAFRVLMSGGRYAALWLAPRQPAAPDGSAALMATPTVQATAALRSHCTAAGFTEVRCWDTNLSGEEDACWTASLISAIKPRD